MQHQARATVAHLRIAALALVLAAFAHAADYPRALLKDPCAAQHPCDAQIWLELDADHPAFQATHDPRGAEHAAPVISPDGKTIAVFAARLEVSRG